jgi:hypothetical protein
MSDIYLYFNSNKEYDGFINKNDIRLYLIFVKLGDIQLI